MTHQPATQPHAREDSIIPGRRESVTALCVHAFLAIMAALGLRLLFVFWFPGSSDDSEMYIQLAHTWADQHVYGFVLNGQIYPTDLRTPGYPAFLAGVALLLGRSIRAILLSQAVLDVLTCFLTAALAAWLAPAGSSRRAWIIALWLAATCPFLANYSAVVLTEVLVTFLTTAALCCFALGFRENCELLTLRDGSRHPTPFACALLGAFLTGVATLVRPEMPLLLGVAALLYALRGWRPLGARKTIVFMAATVGVFLLPLLPWAARNIITLRKVQFIAPRYANLPGEYATVGFYSWTSTWLERYRDVYFTVWKIGEPDQPLIVDELPSTAFDSPDEKARIANLFSEYNNSPDLEISPELDGKFSEIARERTRRHPLRTYVFVPFQRALTIWFTPRTELLPIDGKFWPVREQWADSHADVLVTGGFALLGYLYVALAAGGVSVAWSARGVANAAGPSFELGSNLWGIVLLLGYFLARTAFLTTVEAPEPRYVVSCYPGVLALISMLALRKGRAEKTDGLG